MLFQQLSERDDELLSTPKIKIFLAKFLPKFRELFQSNAILKPLQNHLSFWLFFEILVASNNFLI